MDLYFAAIKVENMENFVLFVLKIVKWIIMYKLMLEEVISESLRLNKEMDLSIE